jgi:hypothetical protein
VLGKSNPLNTPLESLEELRQTCGNSTFWGLGNLESGQPIFHAFELLNTGRYIGLNLNYFWEFQFVHVS